MSKKEINGETFSGSLTTFLLGSTFIASFYIGILTWAQDWEYTSSQLVRVFL